MDADPVRLPLLAIVGPTAVGKTAAALALARRVNGELVGADSVQVYRGFDIGSSKPTLEELGGVRHHLIDIREPEDVLDAATYAALADAAIADISRRGKLPILVGGTGLWLRALLRGLVAAPAVDPVLRARLELEWDAVGGSVMHERLQRADPLSAARIHPNDKLRVVRALEVFEQTGEPLGEAQRVHALGAPRYADRTFVVDLEPEQHRALVRARTAAMLQAGFQAEVAALIAKHGSGVRPLGSVGYRQMATYLTTGGDLAETELAIVRATLLYARRQRTWWNTDPNVRQRVTPETLWSDAVLREIDGLRR